MSKKQTIQVVKINTDRPSFRPKNFPRMPILYLELLENKSKINPKLVNQEYIPKNLPSLPTIHEEKEIIEEYKDSDRKRKKSPQSSPEKSPSPSPEKSPSPSPDSPSPKKSGDSHSPSSPKKSRDSSVRSSPSPASSIKSNISNDSNVSNVSKSKNDDDDLSSRMRELLTSDKKDKREDYRERDKDHHRGRDKDRGRDRDRSRDRDHSRERYQEKEEKRYESKIEDDNFKPPRLSDIAGGNYMPKKVIEEIRESKIDEDDLKRELIFKFQLLKRSYKSNANVSQLPDFTIHSDYKTMLNSYDMAVKQLNIDNNIENYKSYLVTAFYIIEFSLGYWLKFDMQDFTKQQILNMNKYEHLLIELGEKTYVPEGSKWPVEVRLLFTIVINTAIFIITKMVMKKVGSNLFGMMEGLVSSSSNSGENVPNEQPVRKMRAPTIPI